MKNLADLKHLSLARPHDVRVYAAAAQLPHQSDIKQTRRERVTLVLTPACPICTARTANG
eukprot:1393431-Amorphochlora_amoeboformis.AAC.1